MQFEVGEAEGWAAMVSMGSRAYNRDLGAEPHMEVMDEAPWSWWDFITGAHILALLDLVVVADLTKPKRPDRDVHFIPLLFWM